jgi:hypothetical protein
MLNTHNSNSHLNEPEISKTVNLTQLLTATVSIAVKWITSVSTLWTAEGEALY